MKAWLVGSVLLGLSLALLAGGASFARAETRPDGAEVRITTAIDDPLEILFRIGLDELQRGNYASAVAIFEALAQQTPSPRIRLELARALFLDRRYREAAAEFNAALHQPGLPWTVQENIRSYLDAIDAALGYVTFGLSLVSDSNPRNFTDSREVRIAGQSLRIVPPDDNDAVIGVRYTVNGARALTGTASLSGYLNASYADFTNDQFDRWVADCGLLANHRSLPRLSLRLGLEEAFYAGSHQYAFPYLGLIFIPDPVDQFRASSELKIGRLQVPAAGYLDATILTLTNRALMQITEGIQTGGELYLEKSSAAEDVYSYYGGSLGGSLGLALGEAWAVKPFAAIGRRVYAAKDPFFGRTRDDVRKVMGCNLRNRTMAIVGFSPELEMSYEKNDSNIGYYSYDKFLVLLNFIR